MDLITAIKRNNNVAVLKAIQDGYSVHVGLNGVPPLVYAVLVKCDISIIETLLEHGPEMDDALFSSCSVDYFEAFKEILEAGGSVDCVSKSQMPLLHLACKKGEKYLKLLLLHGANPNFTCHQGDTVLHFTIKEKCSVNIINILLLFQANPAIKNNDGQNAEELARACNLKNIAALIKKSATCNPYLASKYPNRRKSMSCKRKVDCQYSNPEINDKLAALQKAEKTLKTCQQSYEQLKKKMNNAQMEMKTHNVTCTNLRKEIANLISGEDIDKKFNKQDKKHQLECPICFTDFNVDTKIFQCPEGHLHCSNCEQHFSSNCVLCGSQYPKTPIRNRALESIVAEVRSGSKTLENIQ